MLKVGGGSIQGEKTKTDYIYCSILSCRLLFLLKRWASSSSNEEDNKNLNNECN